MYSTWYGIAVLRRVSICKNYVFIELYLSFFFFSCFYHVQLDHRSKNFLSYIFYFTHLLFLCSYSLFKMFPIISTAADYLCKSVLGITIREFL